jgi:hypothetical protein
MLVPADFQQRALPAVYGSNCLVLIFLAGMYFTLSVGVLLCYVS